MATGIKNNIPAAIRKIEADQRALASATGIAVADYVNIAVEHSQRMGFLQGTKNRFKAVPGANLGAAIGRGMRYTRTMSVHKSKIVDRGGRLPDVFRQPSWSPSNNDVRPGQAVTKAENRGLQVVVRKTSTGINGSLDLAQGPGGVLAMLAKNPSLQYRRRILKQGLDSTSRRYKKLAEYRMGGVIKKRNKVPIK